MGMVDLLIRMNLQKREGMPGVVSTEQQIENTVCRFSDVFCHPFHVLLSVLQEEIDEEIQIFLN